MGNILVNSMNPRFGGRDTLGIFDDAYPLGCDTHSIGGFSVEYASFARIPRRWPLESGHIDEDFLGLADLIEYAAVPHPGRVSRVFIARWCCHRRSAESTNLRPGRCKNVPQMLNPRLEVRPTLFANRLG